MTMVRRAALSCLAWRAAASALCVLLLPKAGGAAREVAVLATRRWSDTVRTKSLLTQLEMRCGSPAAPTA